MFTDVVFKVDNTVTGQNVFTITVPIWLVAATLALGLAWITRAL